MRKKGEGGKVAKGIQEKGMKEDERWILLTVEFQVFFYRGKLIKTTEIRKSKMTERLPTCYNLSICCMWFVGSSACITVCHLVST
jgi:hypothetical protein